jgi:hypothetical protein
MTQDLSGANIKDQILMSEELSGRIDLSMFESSEDEILFEIWTGGIPLVFSPEHFKIDKDKFTLKFSIAKNKVGTVLTTDTVDSLKLIFSSEPEPIFEFNNVEMISRSFNVSQGDSCLCTIAFKINM